MFAPTQLAWSDEIELGGETFYLYCKLKQGLSSISTRSFEAAGNSFRTQTHRDYRNSLSHIP